MKKLQLIAGFAMLTLVACQKEQTSLPTTSSSSSRAADSSVLVKNVKYFNFRGIYADWDYSYNGNKINTITDKVTGNVAKFTYNGDRIVKWETTNNGVVIERRNYTYNAQGRITRFRRNGKTVTTFSYNNNGVVEAKQVLDNGLIYNVKYAFSGNRVATQTFPDNYTNKFTYDGKNSPYKNIIGFQQIAFFDFSFESLTQLHVCDQNLLIDGRASLKGFEKLDYTYNAANYPTSVRYYFFYPEPGVGTLASPLSQQFSY